MYTIYIYYIYIYIKNVYNIYTLLLYFMKRYCFVKYK